MEEWEQLLDGYPEAPDLKCFIKTLKTANVVLKQDLASFESEWISSTLFFKPVNLLETVASKFNDTPWSKAIGDAYKLISFIVDKYKLDHLYENIVTLCLLPCSPQIRKDALACLTRVTRLSQEGAREAQRLVSELEGVTTCKAQMAVLIGAICEHHPEVVADSAPRIWRIYLNLLDSNKNTDTVTNSVLQGLLGLFKHFGEELPVMEFKDLYEKMSKEYLLTGKCVEACLSILEQHSGLFKELLSKDARLRQHLWSLQASAPLRAVYASVATATTREQLEKIARTELLPRVTSRTSQVRFTALRILRQLGRDHDVTCDVTRECDAVALELEARRGRVSLDAADAIQWCLESNSLYSDKLLQTAVLFYTNIPSTRRREIVVHGLLNAPEDVRTATTTLLITESCQSGVEQYLPLWRDIFDAKGGSDVIVLEGARRVFGDVIDCAILLLEAACEEGVVSPSLSSLLTVVQHSLRVHPVEAYTEEAARRLLSQLTACARAARPGAAVLGAATAAHGHCGGSLRDLCGMVRINKCSDEALLCESCYLLVYAPDGDVRTGDVMTAVEILLSRRDAEPHIMSKALQRLECVINGSEDYDAKQLDRILCQVEKLRSTKDLSNKEARILHRDLVIFMGKYGNNNYASDNLDENMMIAELKDKLVLNIPNPDEGTTYKLNLQRILQLAIMHEHPDALLKLLSVICVTLSNQKDPILTLCLTLVVRALCRAHAHTSTVDPGIIQQAVMLCDSVPCLRALITYISEEKSPGVRKMLSDALEGLLLKDPGSEATEQLVKVVADHAAVMMASGDPVTKCGGLNITDTLLPALKDNHLLQTKELPHLLTLILETGDIDSRKTFQNAYKMLLENLEIYSKETMDMIVEKLTKNLLNNSLDLSMEVERRLYKDKVIITLEFFKEIPHFDSGQFLQHCKAIDLNYDLKLFVLASGGWISDAILEEAVVKMGGMECGGDVFLMEAALMFLEVYRSRLLEMGVELTLQAVGNIIKNIPPTNILNLHKQLRSCLTAYTTGEEMNNFAEDYKKWCLKFDIQSVSDNISKQLLTTDNSTVLKALNMYLELLKIPSNICEEMLNWSDLAFDVYVDNLTSHREGYIETHREYMSNMLRVSLRYKSLNDIQVLILKSFEKVGLEFLNCFLDVFSEYLLKKPYVLVEECMKPVCVILNNVMKGFLKKKYTEEDCISILELIDTIWPFYEEKATFEAKHSLLVQCSCLPVQLHSDSAPMRWAAVLVAEGAPGEGARLLPLLPGGELCSAAYLSFVARLPARLSELSGAALQSLLDACARAADCTLLGALMKLCDCDRTKGWWDEAMASCMAVIARRGDCTLTQVRVDPEAGGRLEVTKMNVDMMSIATSLYEYQSLGVCKRLLIPFLKYCTPSFCERFYSSIINGLLSSLVRWVRGGDRDNLELRTLLKEHARAMALITLALEKIPLPSLKDPESLLYSLVEQKQPSYLMRKVSSICVTQRKKTCPEGASSELRECYRQCQVENYKCLCAAVCVTRPAAKFYDLLFDGKVWETIFDCQVTWKLPVKAQWAQQKTVHTVADVSTGAGRSGGSAGTTRTRMFLRTLSENPLQFDLMDVDEEPTENSQELELVVNELNSQEGADTLTALLRHAASLAHTEWRHRLAGVLAGDWHTNVKWTVAQMVCNCKEELKPHSQALGPALMEMVARTPREVGGRKLLNNLHIDVLETILQWSVIPSDRVHFSSAIEYLINTIVDDSYHVNMLMVLLGRVLDVLSSDVTLPWRCFENYLTVPDKLVTLLRVLLLVTKRKVYIPELLPALVQLDEKLWARDVKLPELFGHALNACTSETGRYLTQYRHFLDRKRQSDVGEYVKMLYYTQLGYRRVCDEFNFKKIIDLTSKVPGPIKSKCLLIMTAYVSSADDGAKDLLEGLDTPALMVAAPLETMCLLGARGAGGRVGRAALAPAVRYVGHSDVKLRGAAVGVMLTAFEDLFGPSQGEPPSRRQKMSSSKLLSTLVSPDSCTAQVTEGVARGLTDADHGVGGAARERVAACLDRGDLRIRLTESFLLAVSIPATLSNKNTSLSVCASAFLDLLFSGLKSQERFKEARLRDEPLNLSNPSMETSKLMTNTRTYQGTFLSSVRTRPRAKQGPTFSGINVQIPIDDILGTIITLAKDKPDVAQAVCIEVTKCILASGSGFESGPVLARACCDALGAPSDVTPLVLGVANGVLDDLQGLIDFDSTLEKLRRMTRCTEGEGLVQLLYEDVMLKRDTDMFELVTVFEDDVSSMDVDCSSPSLEDLTSAFGKLSNWDKLTMQQKRATSSGLPQLWVPEDTFKSWLDNYQVTNTKSWFNKFVSACRDECKQDSLRWLRETDRWPRRHFDISVVTEAIERQDWCDRDIKSSCDIRPSDCLAEWAARIMIRRAFPSVDDSESSDITPCRDIELQWCRLANERGLPQLALNCIQVNSSSLSPAEAIPWRIEMAAALRSLGLVNKDDNMLGEALAVLELLDIPTDAFYKSDVITANKLILALHEDLGTLHEDNLQSLIEITCSHTKDEANSIRNKEMLSTFYEMAMNFYDSVWTDDSQQQDGVLNKMADVLGHVVDLNDPGRAEMFLAVIFNRLDDVTTALNDDTAKNLLEKVSILIDSLDDTSLEEVAKHSALFGRSLESYPRVCGALSPDVARQSRRLQLRLVCDARHALLRRCSELAKRHADPEAWTKTFSLMRESIFDNPHASSSSEYNVLSKYKNELYQIEDYETTEATHKMAVLNKIITELRKTATSRTSLRLSQLCPALAKYSSDGSERDGCMSRLLRLGKLGVVKFYEQVSVFCDAINRPVVLQALLSDGSTRRWIHKTGDRLRVDAATMRAVRGGRALWGGEVVTYEVTPLSEDSGLIEYVENTTRLRDLINTKFDLGSVDIGARAADDELILSSSALEHHREYCRLVPADALRSAIQENCSSMADFISKKRMFTETLSSLTLYCWIFGVGDRHLENILYVSASGGVCGVDWAGACADMTPARLTRLLRAVTGATMLEARLQALVAGLRRCHKLFLQVVKVSFKWMGEEFLEKFPNIEAYACGGATCYDVTRRLLLASPTRYKERIAKLLDDTFVDLPKKERYTVEDQVTCLLRQCTDPRILSVTRSGWEPWA